MNVWLLVTLSIAVVLGCILLLRLHAFLTLLLAGLMVAALGGSDAVQRYTSFQVNKGEMSLEEAKKLQGQSAPARLTIAFGETAGKIGILIALASIIGQCLLESRAAGVIVDRMLKLTGPKRAPEALAASSFVLGIPVFFDTVFYLMVPLARSLRQRLGKDYVLFILAILAGGSIAHSLVPPTPGPLMVAEMIGVDVATMMMAGLVIGGCSSVVSLGIARIINRHVDVPLRFSEEDSDENATDVPSADLANLKGGPTESPSLLASLSPIAIPVVLIAVGSVVTYMTDAGTLHGGLFVDIVRSLGNKNIALAVGVVFALSLLKYCPAGKRASLISRSLASGGNIILITAAGGAFGAMLRQAGIEEAVDSLAHGVPGLMILPLAFVVTAGIRTLQGSATVAMITAAGILAIGPESLPFHPVYLAMAIGAGSKPVSWMTDSAFWVITRMSGMTEAEGLRVISPMSIGMGFSALAFTMLFAIIYPGV
jgi:GntP family gluconate:H+ symporter